MRCLIVALLLLLSACATTTNKSYVQTVSSWRWGDGRQLLQIWGRPTKIATLPNSNKMYIYIKEAYKNYPPPPITAGFATVTNSNGKSVIVVPNPSTPFIGPSYLLKCITSFEVDPRNIIVNIRAQGNNCTADPGFILSKSNPQKKAIPS